MYRAPTIALGSDAVYSERESNPAEPYEWTVITHDASDTHLAFLGAHPLTGRAASLSRVPPRRLLSRPRQSGSATRLLEKMHLDVVDERR
jgi:hypothetical protein